MKGKIYVRCGGTIDRSYKDGIRLRGYHQDVTLDMQKEMEVREKLENALKEAKNANMAKTTFLSQMSHDIRTPLNGIIGLMEISEAHKDNYELVQENRCKARVSAKHLLDLINDILELSKLGDNNTVLAHEAFDLIKLSEDVMTISGTRAKESGITMIHAPYCDEMTVRYIYGSKLHIRQIFLNILDNAIKYNKPGGAVMCSASAQMKDDKHVEYTFVISDTGIGMSEEYISHLYEPFAQANYDEVSVYQGTGLGMSIVKALVDKMEGTIEVDSRLGEGTTFTVKLPFETADEGDIENEKEVQPAGSIEGLNILLVEDNELNMEIASFMLEDAGANVHKVFDGIEAVETFVNTPEYTYDVILMDLMMPLMNGIEATKAIRASNRADAASIPIIAMTANAFAEDVEAVKAAGMNEHIAKPLDMKKVISTIQKYCEK